MNCPNCSVEVFSVDTFCPHCKTFLKEHGFKERDDRDFGEFHRTEQKQQAQGDAASEDKVVIQCTHCQQKLRIRRYGSPVKIICPRCQKDFIHRF